MLIAMTGTVFLMLDQGTSSSSFDWPTFHGNYRRTGYSLSTAPNTNNTLWKYYIGNVTGSSPAVAYGKVFVGSNDHYIYALDAYSGNLIWKHDAGRELWPSPTVASNKVFIWGDYFYCLNAQTGEEIWKFEPEIIIMKTDCASAILRGGRVYIGSHDHNIYSLDASTGAKIWNYTTGDEVRSIAFADGMLFAASLDHTVYGLNETGTFMWKYKTNGEVRRLAIADGRVFVGSDDHHIYSFNQFTGKQIWNYTTGGKIYSGPAIAYGKVFVGSFDNYTYCLDEFTGELIWSYRAVWSVKGSPGVADHKVFFGVSDWWDVNSTNTPAPFPVYFYSINVTTGELVWKYQTGDWVYSSPAIAYGNVYVASHDGYVYAFGEPSVGGIVIPIEKLALLAPYIGLASTIIVATVATSIYVKRVKRRKEKQ